jgi:hypothetical protein
MMVNPSPATAAGLIQIELKGVRVKISGDADPATVSAVVGTLAGAHQ